MDEYDQYDDYGGYGDYSDNGGRESVHALFGSVVAATTPTVGFTPDDVAAGGRVRQRRRQAAAILGGTASVTAVAIAVGMITGGAPKAEGPVRPGVPTASIPTPTVPTPTVPTPTVPTTTPSALPGMPPQVDPDGPEGQATSKLFKVLLADLQTSLDPQHRHLVWTSTTPTSQGGDSTGRWVVLSMSSEWTQDGATAAPGGKAPFVELQLDMQSPGALNQLGDWGDLIQNGTAVPWQHKQSKKLSDDSTVTWVWNNLRVGTEMTVNRVYPDGSGITIHTSDASGWPGEKVGPYKPYPFTTAALVSAISDPALKMPDFP